MRRVLIGLGFFVALAAVNVATVLVVLHGRGTTRAGSDITCYSADFNGDGFLTIIDPVRFLGFLFQDGPPPEACAGGGDPPEPLFTEEEVSKLRDVLPHLSIEFLENGAAGTVKTIRLSAVNFQVVNGLDATNGNEGDPDTLVPDDITTNGTGNIIVGYNETGTANPNGSFRTGSHNIIMGSYNAYSSIGALLVGKANTSEAPYASVVGGELNHSVGAFASITAGRYNTATGEYSSITGGGSLLPSEGNLASGNFSAVLGGSSNEAEGFQSVVVSGDGNVASGLGALVLSGATCVATGTQATVVGGEFNTATNEFAVVCGGMGNEAAGAHSVVSGGNLRSVTGEFDWQGGSLFEED